MAKKTAEELAQSRARAARKAKITAEEKRLRKTYAKLPKDLMAIADGLIRRAAFMRVSLEDYEEDLAMNGYVEKFTQSEKTAAYERERPVARLYNTLNSNYQKIIKQLSDLLPKPDPDMSPVDQDKDDGFDNWMERKHQ